MGQKPSIPQPGKKVQVIGAGLPRTGTASFSAALSILLNGPVYHSGTQITLGPASEIKSWIRILRLWGTGQPNDRKSALGIIESTLDGYVAVTDSPGDQLVPELLEVYPDALVIATTRDAQSWERSMSQVASLSTLWFLRVVLLPLPGMRWFVDYTQELEVLWIKMFGVDRPNVGVYGKHLERLRDVVPPEKLRLFNVKDGWEPLCEMLGVDVPEVPFPRINDSEAIDRTAQYHIRRGLLRWGAVVAVVGAVVWGWRL
ncbi:sulfotransferase family protein [Aspergillus puulaauensis]|uniref:P-loop containing nucleoside triphosphate hydrolase protein n=1 Tax=Aspergillus puulaauensis TaxID=1220207 RepID=A0A7R7X9Y9_9EURO|nr:uncharacterized protein APUU_10183A [Aspergillus puulaauensis]BCS17355.1 hypothetical protein APUU_10183A [Aspergillus puulaauensis]